MWGKSDFVDFTFFKFAASGCQTARHMAAWGSGCQVADGASAGWNDITALASYKLLAVRAAHLVLAMLALNSNLERQPFEAAWKEACLFRQTCHRGLHRHPARYRRCAHSSTARSPQCSSAARQRWAPWGCARQSFEAWISYPHYPYHSGYHITILW